MSLYEHVPHPHIAAHHKAKPVRVADQLPRKNAVDRFNTWVALKITTGVGTMWCAYLFTIIALLGLRPALKPGGEGLVAWIAQTFIQLVLLSIIMVGQNVQSAASDKRSQDTYNDAEAVLHEALEIQNHLAAQDAAFEAIAAKVGVTLPAMPAKPAPISASP
jgi:hypothetical protein